MVDDSFVPSSKQPSVIYYRLRDFIRSLQTINRFALPKRIDKTMFIIFVCEFHCIMKTSSKKSKKYSFSKVVPTFHCSD